MLELYNLYINMFRLLQSVYNHVKMLKQGEEVDILISKIQALQILYNVWSMFIVHKHVLTESYMVPR